MATHLDSLIFRGEETGNAEHAILAFASLSAFVYLVPVSVEDQQTSIISGLAGLQSLNSLS